jgi:hypothetical protein
MSTALFDFPTIVAASLLSNWLDAKALRDLDSACTNKVTRATLLRIFSCEGFKVQCVNTLGPGKRSSHSSNYVKWLKLRGLSTEQLKLSEESVETVTHLDLATCRRLKSLFICSISARTLAPALSSAPLLQRLTVHDLVRAPRETESQQPEIALSTPCLTELIILRTSKLNSDLVQLLDGRKLEALTLGDCREVSKSFMQNLAQKVQPERFHSLFLKNIPTLTDTRLARLLRSASGLRKLSLRYCPGITCDIYETLQHCKALQCLRIERNAQDHRSDEFDESPFVAFTLICTELRELAFYNMQVMTDVSLKAILQNALRVEKLTIVGCHDIRGEGRLLQTYQQAPALHTLYMGSCSLLTGLLNICEICPHLRNLQVLDCYDFSYAACTQVFRYGTRLETLSLRDCILLYGYDLDAIAAGNLPLLTSLDLTRCCYLTDEGIESIVAICPALRSLQLQDCNYNLTARALQSVALGCCRLESLNIKDSTCAAQSALLNALENCPLRVLKVSWQAPNSAGITADTLLSMAAITPRSADPLVLSPPPLQLQTMSIHGFQLTGPNITALTTLLDACLTLRTLYLSCCAADQGMDIPGSDYSRRTDEQSMQHLAAYAQLLRRVYRNLTIHIIAADCGEDDFR